jgi:flagellar basal-body rod protein FlgG
MTIRRDFAQGALRETGNPFDLAISGPGLFQLRDGDRMIYSRQGQFSVSSDGALVTAQGYRLQQAGGGDLILDRAQAVAIELDGTVLADGVPIARVELYESSSNSTLEAVGEAHFSDPTASMAPTGETLIRQRMVEGSNVDLGDEMVAMTATVRQSETGARLVQVWDDLIGRAITTFGGGR